MKELERWWRWFDNELPELDRALKKLHERLDDAEKDALRCAASFIECRQKGQRLSFVDATGGDAALSSALRSNSFALRDLSLDLCRSFERLNEQVSKDPPKPWKKLPHPDGGGVYGDTFLNRYRSEQEQYALRREYNIDRIAAERSYLGGGYYMRQYLGNWAAPVRIMAVDLNASVDANTSGKP